MALFHEYSTRADKATVGYTKGYCKPNKNANWSLFIVYIIVMGEYSSLLF